MIVAINCVFSLKINFEIEACLNKTLPNAIGIK